MAGITNGRYTAWIANEQDLKRMLRELGSATIFDSKEFAKRCAPGAGFKPMRITVIVHRPRLSPEALLRRQRERARKLNGKRAATQKSVNGS